MSAPASAAEYCASIAAATGALRGAETSTSVRRICCRSAM